MAELTPMMRQYMDVKEQNPDSLLFFRLGDFYEMFGADARTASQELDLALTTRDKDKTKAPEDKIPMCGIPYHSADAYIARLIAKGYKVSICEQTEDPALAKGLVQREVIRTVTPGTVLDDACLDAGRSNYLCGVYLSDTAAGLCACDVSTGQAHVTVFTGEQRITGLINELGRFAPAEAVMNAAAYDNAELAAALENRFACRRERLGDGRYDLRDAEKKVRTQFGEEALSRLPRNDAAPLLALGGLLTYLYETQKTDLKQLDKLEWYRTGQFMELDLAARRNLELTETLRSKEKKGSLLVPAGYVDENGFRLGVWISNLRAARKARPESFQVTPEHIAMLDAIGMQWDAREAKWQCALRRAGEYRAAHGDLTVPVNYKTEDGFCLGDWIRRMRESYAAHDARLTPERVENLSALGMVWTPAEG